MIPREIDEIKEDLVHYYRGFMISNKIHEEIRIIKRMNLVFAKLETTGKDIHANEIVSIVKILNNQFHLNKIRYILHELVDLKYHDTLDYIIDMVVFKDEL